MFLIWKSTNIKNNIIRLRVRKYNIFHTISTPLYCSELTLYCTFIPIGFKAECTLLIEVSVSPTRVMVSALLPLTIAIPETLSLSPAMSSTELKSKRASVATNITSIISNNHFIVLKLTIFLFSFMFLKFDDAKIRQFFQSAKFFIVFR